MLFALAVLVLSSPAQADQLPPDMIKEGLKMAGFTKLASTSSALNYVFRDEIAYTISKTGFSNRDSAREFCSANSKALGQLEETLLIPMSGAANIDPELLAAVTIDVKGERNDAPVWIPEAPEELVKQAGGDIVVIGSGMSSSVETLSVINAKLAEHGLTPITLRAICTKKLK